ncbi:MAG: sulfatase-like hydrolase/transferase, partial [Verrucomicrobia bacterium]|nr:sulfatase-like hydrolase/transferase [Verrucomicrobiota bacterium]
YPSQHNVIHQNRLREDIPTIAELLQERGYQTAGFVNNSQVGKLVGFDRGHDDFFEVWQGLSERQVIKRAQQKVQELAGYSDHGAATTNKLVFDWLRQRRRHDKPFFLFIHYIDAHNPFKAPRPFRFKYFKTDVRREVDMTKVWKIADNPLICYTDDLAPNEAEIEAITALYDEEIGYVDDQIGRLVDYLKKMNVLDESLLILTADHGEHLGEHGFFSHVASLYEPIVHIPLILRYPFGIDGQSVSRQPVQHIDILPTILAACDFRERKGLKIPGLNLLDCLDIQASSRLLFAEWEGRIPHFVRNRLRDSNHHSLFERFQKRLWMIRSEEFKLIADSQGHFELYNLRDDPKESVNLCNKQTATYNKLRTALENWRDTEVTGQTSESYDYSGEVLKKHLKALGYL